MSHHYTTAGHGVDNPNYTTEYDTVAEVNEAIHSLMPILNLPVEWWYYEEDRQLAVSIYMPRKNKSTQWLCEGVTLEKAQTLDRDALRALVKEFYEEEQL